MNPECQEREGLNEEKSADNLLKELENIEASDLQNTLDKEIWKKIMQDIDSAWKCLYIPKDIINEFKEKVREFSLKELVENNNQASDAFIKTLFWDGWLEVKNQMYSQEFASYLFPYYIKSLWLSNYVSIIKNLDPFFTWIDYWAYQDMLFDISIKDWMDKIYWFIKKYGEKSESYLKYLSNREWNYIQKWALLLKAWEKTEGLESMASIVNFLEVFDEEPESINLFEFLESNPQKLSNLWGKVIKEIDLNIDNWINFCFRWIITMVKSRNDLQFPHLSGNPTPQERELRKSAWTKIIHEYENILRKYIEKDFSFNNQWEKKEKPREQTFDKIFYARGIWDFTLDNFHINKEVLEAFSSNSIADYSYITEITDENTSNKKQEQILKDVEKYVKSHPNEQVLVCIDEHWGKDGSSLNWWSKEDRLKLANLSPNLKIWSFRCYFWTAFENETITKNLSSVSWYSNKTPTQWQVANIINESSKYWLWYHEMEIYIRLHYLQSISPLTETLPYTNLETHQAETRKIELADNRKIWDSVEYSLW